MARAVDDAHAAVPDHLLESVGAELIADLRDPRGRHRASVTGERRVRAATCAAACRGRCLCGSRSLRLAGAHGEGPRVEAELRDAPEEYHRTDAPACRAAPELGTEVAATGWSRCSARGAWAVVYLARGPEGGLCALKVLSRRLLGEDAELRDPVQAGSSLRGGSRSPARRRALRGRRDPRRHAVLRDAVRGRPRSRGAVAARRRVRASPQALVDPRADR